MLNLILFDDFYPIPSKFPRLSDVDQVIYNSLITKGQYIIKSNVSKEVLESFIDNWVNCSIPQFTTTNIIEFELLSSEFGRMQNMIQIFKSKIPNSHNYVLFTKINSLKCLIKMKSDILASKVQNYRQIIDVFLKNEEIKINSDFFTSKDKMIQCCALGKTDFFANLIKEKVVENGIIYALNERDKTADVFGSEHIKSNVFIPYSIKANSKEYVVKRILKKAFLNDTTIKAISFPENSEIDSIEKNAFKASSLEKITIPSKITRIIKKTFNFCFNLASIEFSEHSKIQIIEKEVLMNTPLKSLTLPSSFSGDNEGWCHGLEKLTDVKIIQKDVQNISYFEEKYILGKTDSKSDVFDILIFARRDIEEAIIPPFIRRIASNAFQLCEKLETVIFPEESELESIGSLSFSRTRIQSFTIPKHVKNIDMFAFNFCKQLKEMNCLENSELESIGDCVFMFSSIKRLTVPSSVHFSEKSFSETADLTQIKIIQNDVKNISYIDDKFIVRKTDQKSDVFDVLLFARRDIGDVTIPSQIRVIASLAFNQCNNVKRIDFLDDSQLEIINQKAFFHCSFSCLTIPSTVKELREGWCSFANKLKDVKIMPNNPNFRIVDNKLIVGKTNPKSDNFDIIFFAFRNIRSIIIPSNITRIAEYAFSTCLKLRCVEFADNSQLNSIGKNSFSRTPIAQIKIPKSVTIIEQEAFDFCQLTNVEFSEDSELRIIQYVTFSLNKITSIALPSKLALIQDYAFYESGIVMADIPENSQLNAIKFNVFGKFLVNINAPHKFVQTLKEMCKK